MSRKDRPYLINWNLTWNNVKSIEKNEKNIESYGRHTLLSANVSDFGVSTDDISIIKSQLCTMILKKNKRAVRTSGAV